MTATTSSGIYVLDLRFSTEAVVVFTKRKAPVSVGPGRAFLYIGSAQGGRLESRVRRHQRKRKTRHWNVDHLTTVATSVDAIVRPGRPKEDECTVAQALAALPFVEPVLGFGNADCRAGCVGHLVIVPLEHVESARALVEAPARQRQIKLARA